MRDADTVSPARLARDALYLGILTARGVKPLSRLEYSISHSLAGILLDMGLERATLTRWAENGAAVAHTVISRERARIEDYLAEFDRTPLAGRVPAAVLSEARHFGYPACCAESFSRRGYAPNDLAPADQRILFHHACPGCRVTPGLLPAYRAAYAEAGRLMTLISGSPSPPVRPHLRPLSRAGRGGADNVGWTSVPPADDGLLVG